MTTPPPAVLARHIETLIAAAKRLRLGVEGPRIADELEAIAASLAQQGEAVACYRAHWPGGDVGTWTDGAPNPQSVAYGEHHGLRFEYAYTHPAAVAVDEAMASRLRKALPFGCAGFVSIDAAKYALTAALQPASEGENNG